MAACAPLDLQNRTPSSPCVGWWCTLEDFRSVRALLVLEHNALVRGLNAFNRLVAAGTVKKWTPLPTAAWEVYEESWRLLQAYPADYASGWFDTDIYMLETPIVAMIQMATRVHSALCDVNNELEAAGQDIPSQPTQPEEEKGTVEEAIDFAKATGRGVVKIVALGVFGVLGYAFLTRK